MAAASAEERYMARGQNDLFETRLQLANAYRFAIENGVPFDAVEDTARKLARVMRETGTLPEQMVIAVKEAIYLGGAGPARTAADGEHTARRALFDKLVTLAIGEYYASEVPALFLMQRVDLPTTSQTSRQVQPQPGK